MRITAVVNIATSIGTSIICGIIIAIFYLVNNAEVKIDFNLFSTIGFGIALLVLSLFCDYGAELEENKVEIKENNDQIQ